MSREYKYVIDDLECAIEYALKDITITQVMDVVISVYEREFHKEVENRKKQLEEEYAGYKEKYEAMKKLMECK